MTYLSFLQFILTLLLSLCKIISLYIYSSIAVWESKKRNEYRTYKLALPPIKSWNEHFAVYI